MISCANPAQKSVPQKPVRFPASKAANQKITGITVLIRIVAAGTNTETAVTCNASGIAAAVVFKKATTNAPITCANDPHFFSDHALSG